MNTLARLAKSASAAKARMKRNKKDPLANLSKKKPRYAVLVWDDDKLMCKNLASSLRRCGLRVIADPDQKRLWQKAAKTNLPIVGAYFDWIDQKRQDYDAGIRAVRYVHARYGDCHVTVFSGHGDQLSERRGADYSRAAYDAGADQVVLKGTLNALDDREEFGRRVWSRIALKQGERMVSNHPELDLHSVCLTWMKENDPSNGAFLLTDSRYDSLKVEMMGQHIRTIESVYADLSALVDPSGGISDQAAFDVLTSELKELQKAEAERMRAVFEQQRPLSADEAQAYLATRTQRAS